MTYSPENYPKNGSLDPHETQRFLKRLRQSVWPKKIRYFLVGEYGDNTGRAHYHASIFGLDPLVGGGPNGLGGRIAESWGLGHTFVGDLTPQSASYVSGYVTKKMTSKDDSRLNGRYPEFARMSLRPGIGAFTMEMIGKALDNPQGMKILDSYGLDVPTSLKHGTKNMPLGRYLRGKLREYLGFGSKDVPAHAKQKFAEEMRVLFENALADPANSQKTLGRILVDDNAQGRLNLEGRIKLKEAVRPL